MDKRMWKHTSRFSESHLKVLSQLGVIHYASQIQHITPVFSNIISKVSAYIKVNARYFDILSFLKSHRRNRK